jgi:hypothetical protein
MLQEKKRKRRKSEEEKKERSHVQSIFSGSKRAHLFSSFAPPPLTVPVVFYRQAREEHAPVVLSATTSTKPLSPPF